jgi:hypothetical protein
MHAASAQASAGTRTYGLPEQLPAAPREQHTVKALKPLPWPDGVYNLWDTHTLDRDGEPTFMSLVTIQGGAVTAAAAPPLVVEEKQTDGRVVRKALSTIVDVPLAVMDRFHVATARFLILSGRCNGGGRYELQTAATTTAAASRQHVIAWKAVASALDRLLF